MSKDQVKETAWNAGKVSASVAVITLLTVMTKGVWTVAQDWGTFSARVLSIDERLQEHIRQTQEAQKSIDERLRRLENRIGLGGEKAWK